MRNRLLNIFLATSFFFGGTSCAWLPPSAVAADSSSVANSSQAPVPVTMSAQIVILPFLSVGQKCSLTVVDASGKSVSAAGVNLNEELFVSDSMGIVTFTVPNAESFELSLQGEARRRIAKRKFKRVTDNVFAESDTLAEAAAALLSLEGTAGNAPVLTYSPTVVCPGDTFVLLGHYFSEKISDNVVDIDGLNAPVLSASKDGIVAIAPLRLRIGPQREISVSVNNQASNIAELDIAAPFYSHVKTETDDVSPEKGKLGMNGTNVPCLIRVVNPNTDTVSLWSPKQEPLGKTNVLLTPGGDQNYLDIDMRFVSRSKVEPKIELSLEQTLAAVAIGKSAPPQLFSAACRAEIIRLERRKIAAEYRLESLRKMSGSELTAKTLDADKADAESKALSLRIQRLRRSLSSRRVIFESFGNTDAQYRQVLDDAAGGAGLTLDQSTKPIQIVSDGGVGYTASAMQFKSTTNGSIRKARSHRMMEPVIRLLPPMTPEQLSIFKSMSSDSSSVTAGSSIKTTTTVTTTTTTTPQSNPTSNSNEPQLRGQEFIEPEPKFSESSRAGLGQPGDSIKKVVGNKKKSPSEETSSKTASTKDTTLNNKIGKNVKGTNKKAIKEISSPKKQKKSKNTLKKASVTSTKTVSRGRRRHK